MSRFWYPYDSFADAQNRLCRFADETIGFDCGVSFSDGAQIAALRIPGPGPGRREVWLNVLAQHVSRPPTSHAAPGDRFGQLEAWFERILTIEGQAEIDSAQAQMAGAQMMEQATYTHVWLPTHEFLLRHKLAVDAIGIALDVVGVIAGAIFFVAAAPELAAAGTAVATAGLVTGTLASLGLRAHRGGRRPLCRGAARRRGVRAPDRGRPFGAVDPDWRHNHAAARRPGR